MRGIVVLASLLALSFVAAASAHKERPATFPDATKGRVPALRTTGPSLVVCKPDSRARIARLPAQARAHNLALLAQCRFAHVQAAVDAATNGTRILVLPGVYGEEPSRAKPNPDPACAGLEVAPASGTGAVPGYEYTRRCPNAQNLIAIVGDADGDGDCDDKCDIQIEGAGATPADVLITGDRAKLNTIRADRADGVALANFTIQFSDFNNVYVIETNGFRLERIVSRWSREYGFLSFVSDNGLYDRVVAYANGDSGIYPGSGPEGHCARYGIEIRNSDSYGNEVGLAGTAGNGLWIHDNRFHGNSVGIGFDSFFAGHPGMPQDCSKIERNRIYSNNLDLFTVERDAYCKQPPLGRDPRRPCPTGAVPVGTGMVIAGGNGNILRDNWIYDNWRRGVMLFWVPAALRNELDPDKRLDTSHDNRFTGNHMGVRPDGKRDANGVDFWWDEEGRGNCWERNVGPGGRKATGDPARLPACPGSPTIQPVNQTKFEVLVACGGWHPIQNPNPAGCDWLKRPKEPR